GSLTDSAGRLWHHVQVVGAAGPEGAGTDESAAPPGHDAGEGRASALSDVAAEHGAPVQRVPSGESASEAGRETGSEAPTKGKSTPAPRRQRTEGYVGAASVTVRWDCRLTRESQAAEPGAARP